MVPLLATACRHQLRRSSFFQHAVISFCCCVDSHTFLCIYVQITSNKLDQSACSEAGLPNFAVVMTLDDRLQVVARGSCHSNEGLKLEEVTLRAEDAKLLLRGGLLGPNQNATLMLTDFPVALLQPLFRHEFTARTTHPR